MPGEHAGKSLGGHGVEQKAQLALGRDRGQRQDFVARTQGSSKRIAATLQRQPEQRSSIEVEQIERQVRNRPAGLSCEPTLELIRVGSSGSIHDHEFAVKDGGPGGYSHAETQQFWWD